MVISGLQGWNPSWRTVVPAFCFFFSRALLMLVILDIVLTAQAEACDGY
jgi:hypothetical protein